MPKNHPAQDERTISVRLSREDAEYASKMAERKSMTIEEYVASLANARSKEDREQRAERKKPAGDESLINQETP